MCDSGCTTENKKWTRWDETKFSEAYMKLRSWARHSGSLMQALENMNKEFRKTAYFANCRSDECNELEAKNEKFKRKIEDMHIAAYVYGVAPGRRG